MPRRQRQQGICSQAEVASSSSAPTGSGLAWKKLLVFGGLLVTLGINARLLNWQARVLESQDPQQQQHPTTTRHVHEQREDPTIMGIYPPDLRPMDPLNNPRDACLVNIRQRHEDLLRVHVDQADHILYLDPSYHANVGDTMLSMGVLKFLEASKKKITQCHYTQTTDYIKLHCDDAIRNLKATKKYKNVLAVWHAGGNWGDIYPHVMRPRIRSFGLLLEAGFKILAMPSSYHYSNPLVEKRQTNQIATKVQEGLVKSSNITHASTSQERVVFTWREQYSYERALEQYPFATNLLVPDIAFQLGPYIMDEYPPQYDFLAFLRIDRESKVNRDSVQAIVDKQRAQQGRLNFTVADWPARYDMFGSPDPLDLKTAIQLMGVGRVAIADRLHATILTLLVNRPIVYVDQMTRKINKTLGVAMATGGCPNHNINEFGLYQAEGLEEAVHMVVQILNQQQQQPQDAAVVVKT